MGSKRRRPSASQTIGGVLFGFEQQVLRSTPPPHELVHHARPDDPVAAGNGTMVSIEVPVLEPVADESAQDLPARPGVPEHQAGDEA